MEKEQVVYKILFCGICHKVKRVGKWIPIDHQISLALKMRNDWKPVFVTCPDCDGQKLVEVAFETTKKTS